MGEGQWQSSKRVGDCVASRSDAGADRSNVLWQMERDFADAGCTVPEIVALVRARCGTSTPAGTTNSSSSFGKQRKRSMPDPLTTSRSKWGGALASHGPARSSLSP
jgi:hypothetical protein